MLAIFYKKYQSGEQLLMKVGLLHWDICPWNGVGEQCWRDRNHEVLKIFKKFNTSSKNEIFVLSSWAMAMFLLHKSSD